MRGWFRVQRAGMVSLEALLEQERTAVCGPAWGRRPAREYVRGGHAPGELCLGGRLVKVARPRVRRVSGGEVRLPSWQQFAREDPLNERAVEQMVIGVSTRKYKRALEPLPEGFEERATSKSAVSRRFVAMTADKLSALLKAPLEKLDVRVVMLDGIHFADHVIVVALGIDSQGKKHVLGLWEGATENAAVCVSLLTSLRDRGLSTKHSMLFVIDGGKAIAKAIQEVFGESALIQRCQVHKRRNVLEHLPQSARPNTGELISQAYSMRDPSLAKRRLEGLAKSLESAHPAAATSLREGLEETLTVMGIGLTHALTRSLSTTNPIENLQGSIRRTSRRVDRWRGGSMILRWVATSVAEAAAGFRCLKGKASMPTLIAYLKARDLELGLASHSQAA